MTLARLLSTPEAKWMTKSSSGIQAKACSSTKRWPSAGVGGPPLSSPPSDSPLSRPNAARYTSATTFGASVPSDDRRPSLAPQDLPQAGDVGGERRLRELRRSDCEPCGLQRSDHVAPARTISPGAV